MEPVFVESLDHEGHGVGRVDGKVVFIDGALPGERVEISVFRRKPSFDQAKLSCIRRESPYRIAPRCPHFGVCGGCSLQHLEFGAQVAAKQRTLEDALWHIGKVRPEQILPAIFGPAWGYRHRARLSARYVVKKGGALVGFRERHRSYVADMRGCEVLPPAISRLIVPLRELIEQLSVRERLPQVEVAVGDEVRALVLRILEPLNDEDETLVRRFAEREGVQLWLQPRGPDSAFLFHPPEAPGLAYGLPEFDVRMPFLPTEFTQVNPGVNRVLVRRVVMLLNPVEGERIADFFCGLGNFSLPLARRGASVTGYEGAPALVARAGENAALNGLSHRAQFSQADLFRVDAGWVAEQGHFHKWMVDPPRDGCIELVKALPEVRVDAPRRIVYVSCNPTTLARDAGVLVHVKNYRLRASGIVNMFPHTSHVESVALFERD
jgi:23S rRNA (uracil1939-C5)-methyltransferase